MKQTNMARRMNSKRKTALNTLKTQLEAKGYKSITGKFVPLSEESKKRVEKEISILQSRIIK